MTSETGKNYINHVLSSALSELKLTSYLDVLNISSPEAQFGDYSTNAGLILAKKLKQNPKVVAEKIIEGIKKEDAKHYIKLVEEKGGFINFTFSEEFLIQNLSKIISERDLFGASLLGGGKKILVEYFQPNVAKPLHLGHLRTAIIGDCLFRVFSSQGFKAESDTHLGDWGTQFGLVILAYKKYGDISVIEKNPIEELNKLYVKINSEIENNTELREEGKAEFVKLEKGDAENRELWKKFRDWSWQEFDVVYRDLEIRKADNDWPESFFEDKMPAVISELKEKGLLKESQGAQIVDLEEYNLGVAVILKSDGGTTYLLRDLATYIFRKAQGFEKQFYVVDVRQSHTLKQTFKILELLGHITSTDEAIHIAYGFLTLPEGAMSTRKGTVVGAKEFIENVQQEALKIIEEKNPELESKSEVAKQVAAGALKYFDLSHNLKSDIVFDPKKAITFEGNTGPYLMYTHARIHGILRKSSLVIPEGLSASEDLSGIQSKKENSISLKSIKLDPGLEAGMTQHELSVLSKLLKFPETVSQVAEDYLPNILCNYLFELSQTFNAFYQEVPVLQEEDEEKKNFRLQLITATAQVIKNGLYLLGIDAPQEM
jgi:arginyl-tRNA synthetase